MNQRTELKTDGNLRKEMTWKIKLDLETIMSSLRMDFVKEGISFKID